MRRLARLVEENHLSELRYEEGDTRITLRTASYYRVAPTPLLAASGMVGSEAVASGYHAAEEAEAAVREVEEKADEAALLRVEAPLMGVFYRAPGQDTPPFIEIGDTIEVGQIIGLIEAMKVFSEVPSEHAGTVKDIPAKSGALVQPGDALAILEPVE